jgi:hypothetical protein
MNKNTKTWYFPQNLNQIFGKPFHDMVYLLFILFLVQTTFILHLPKINPLKTSTKTQQNFETPLP